MSGPTARAAPIAPVLFLDIVGYSRASTPAQGRLLEQAMRDTGPFGDHLQRILVAVPRLPPDREKPLIDKGTASR